jgi:pimeloyl-ACP methyl ester carboxylesterase
MRGVPDDCARMSTVTRDAGPPSSTADAVTIYRSTAGRDAVHAFAREALERWGVDHTTDHRDSLLGPTHVVAAGDGQPLVLLAGTNFCAATWLDLVGMLAATHRVHAVDLPGQPGLSHGDRPRRPRDVYGRWLADLLPRISDAPAVLVGHSLGARVVLQAVAAGAAVAGMVLLDPAGLIRLRVTPRVMAPTIPWLLRPGTHSSRALLRMMMAPGHVPPASLTTWMTLVGRHVRTSLAPAPLPAVALRQIAGTPCVVATGRHDAFVPPAPLSRAIPRKLPGAAFREVPDGGHLVPHERADAVVDLVGDVDGGINS